MQPLADCRLSLHCCECEENFTSAALLLQHFGGHVSSSSPLKKKTSSSSWSSPSSSEPASPPPPSSSFAPPPLKQYPGCRKPIANGASAKETLLRRRQRHRRRRRWRWFGWKGKDCADSGLTEDGGGGSDNESDNGSDSQEEAASAVPEDDSSSILQSVLKDQGEKLPPAKLEKVTSPVGLIVLKLDLQERVKTSVPKLVLPSGSPQNAGTTNSVGREGGGGGPNAPKVDKIVLCNPGRQTLLPGDLVTITTNSDKLPQVKMLLPADSNGQTKRKISKVVSSKSRDVTEEEDDFDPSTFCQVTLEEGEGRLDLGSDLEESSPSKTPSPASLPPPPRLIRRPKALSPPLSSSSPTSHQTNPKPNGALQQQKKYVCSYCHKRFGWSTDLKRHILTHTGERPFVCRLCGADFTRNFLLQKHTARVHPGTWVDGVSGKGGASGSHTNSYENRSSPSSLPSKKPVQAAVVEKTNSSSTTVSTSSTAVSTTSSGSSLGVRKKLILKLKPRTSASGAPLVWNGSRKKGGLARRVVWKAESGSNGT